MKKVLIEGWLALWLRENYNDGLKVKGKYLKWKKDLPNHSDYHSGLGVCEYGQADGPDDFIKDCECPKGWFE